MIMRTWVVLLASHLCLVSLAVSSASPASESASDFTGIGRAVSSPSHLDIALYGALRPVLYLCLAPETHVITCRLGSRSDHDQMQALLDPTPLRHPVL